MKTPPRCDFIRRCRILLAILLLPCFASVSANAADDAESESTESADPAQLKFFEERIRPVLVEHCYSCHSADAKSIKGGLVLDSREGILAGGDSGPALVPKKAADSLLLQAMKHESLEMPPERKLPENVIADFSKWIENGAADPRTGGVVQKKQAIDISKGREFWSFRPVQKTSVPEVGREWAKNGIDHFVAATQQEKLSSSQSLADAVAGDASADALIRRLTFVLSGLAPTLEEQQQFASAMKTDPDAAIAATVDRLLASPRYGERWGRHWLDVTRFAESTGGGRSMMLPDAWRFRDYVIGSFNEDKPFDQLIREHLAGDLLPADSDAQRDEQVIGVGYLMLGAINYEEQDKEQLRMDVVDEQIDSMGRTFLGMTLGCCRCHDHKFDPIPTTDYYALAGIFRSTKSLTPGNVCGFVTAPLKVGFDKAALEQWTAKDAEFEKQIAALKAIDTTETPGRPGAPALKSLQGIVVDDSDAQFDGEWVGSSFQQPFVGAGYRHAGSPRLGISATYEAMLPEDGEYVVRMVINHAESRSDKVPVLISHADGESVSYANQQLKPPGDGVFAELGRYRFEKSQVAKVVVKASEASPGYVIVDAVQFVPVALMPSAAPTVAKSGEKTESREAVEERKTEIKRLEKERKELAKQKPEIPVAMCVEDEKTTEDWHVHVRGEIRNLGPKVPRGFITVATPAEQSAAITSGSLKSTSGRRELADWVASPQNPLTARVYVNRVWANLVGEGLVRTPDNFGETGERATHPELLDYLAATFMEEGWSTKKLIRRICLSRTFRMSASGVPKQLKSDPDNRLLTRANRRRLDAEALRDSLMQISGMLDLSVASGRTIAKLSTYDNEYRHAAYPLRVRSVYVPSFRNTMLDLFEIFDGANPNLVTGKRTRSTRPAQALYMLNSPFVMEQAKLSAENLLKSPEYSADNAEDSIRRAWRKCLSREPSREELQATLNVIGEDPRSVEAWTEVFHALFASVDFRFLD
jgi:cytochrome c553